VKNAIQGFQQWSGQNRTSKTALKSNPTGYKVRIQQLEFSLGKLIRYSASNENDFQ